MVLRLITSCDSIGKPQRNINYDYFKENIENIQQQSICFSWFDLVILIDLLKLYKASGKTNEKYKKNSEQFNKFINLRYYCSEKVNNLQIEYFLLAKINYSPGFSKQIENILEDNYLALMSNKEKGDQNVLFFKNV